MGVMTLNTLRLDAALPDNIKPVGLSREGEGLVMGSACSRAPDKVGKPPWPPDSWLQTGVGIHRIAPEVRGPIPLL